MRTARSFCARGGGGAGRRTPRARGGDTGLRFPPLFPTRLRARGATAESTGQGPLRGAGRGGGRGGRSGWRSECSDGAAERRVRSGLDPGVDGSARENGEGLAPTTAERALSSPEPQGLYVHINLKGFRFIYRAFGLSHEVEHRFEIGTPFLEELRAPFAHEHGEERRAGKSKVEGKGGEQGGSGCGVCGEGRERHGKRDV
jgi:hypothetical protein